MNSNLQLNSSVSFAKGIGILLMVLCHAGFQGYFHILIYMFHMPLFFFISGYCFKETYLNDFKEFLSKRFKRLYIPCIKYCMIFLFLHNVFFYLNIYNDTYGFLGEISRLYVLNDYLNGILLSLFSLKSSEQLLGGYWFIHTLFFSSFIFYFTLKFLNAIFGFLFVISISFLFYFFNLRIPLIDVGGKEFYAVTFMIAGYMYRLNSIGCFCRKNLFVKIFVCTFLLLFGSFFWISDMLKMTYFYLIPYFASALSGSIIVFALSEFCVRYFDKISRLIIYIGNNTLKILTWHFLCFKIVSLFLIVYYNLSIEHLSMFPTIEPYSVQGWWIMYFVVGAITPLIFSIKFKKYTLIGTE